MQVVLQSQPIVVRPWLLADHNYEHSTLTLLLIRLPRQGPPKNNNNRRFPGKETRLVHPTLIVTHLHPICFPH